MYRIKNPIWTAVGTLALAVLVLTPAASADQVISDDLIVQGSACIGLDCNNGESFGFETLRLKENNLRIRFQDTSASASFPSVDWQITANDSTNGGANKFSIDDLDSSRTPFTIEAGAPSHSLYVDDGGRIGFGTSVPVVELHVVDGDTPTLRLQQDGSSGFTPQIWDVAGNESGFFVRDATNGSTLPLRVRPGAPGSSIDIAPDGDVGVGTDSPDAPLDVERLSSAPIPMVKVTANSNTAIDLANTSDGSTFWRLLYFDTGGDFVITDFPGGTSDAIAELTLSQSGNLTVSGELFSTSCVAPCAPDYVFEPDYNLLSLEELGEFVETNKHLPNVPSAEELTGPININDLQMRLLEKVEELTLYTLQQHQTIGELQARLASLEDEDESE